MAASEKALLAAADLLANSARSMQYVVDRMESIAEQQASVLDRLADKLDSIGKGGSGEGIASKVKGFGQGTKDLASGLGEIAKILPELTKGLIGFNRAKKGSSGFVGFVNSLSEAIGQSTDDGTKKVSTQYADFSTAFNSISDMLPKLTAGLFLFNTFTTEKGNQRFADFIVDFFKRTNKEINAKKVKQGAEAIADMSAAIAMFGLTLALTTPLFVIGALGSLVIIPLVAGYAYLFSLLGDKENVDAITNGAKALAWMGVGLISFAIGLFAVKQLAGGDWGEFATGSLIVAVGAFVFSGLFYMLGGKEYAERVERGSKALLFTGLALASLAIGIFVFQALNIGLVPMLMAGLAVAVVGLAFGLIGNFAGEVQQGAAALFFSGIAIASVALGLWVFQKMEIGLGTVLIAGLAIGIMGLMFGIAGAVAGDIALGALAFLGVALAIIAVGYGFEQFKKNKIELSDIGLVSGVLLSMGLIMAGAGAISWLILPGAAALIASGFALISITRGLNAFKTVDFNEGDADKMGYVISSLAASFSLAGGKEGMSSFMGIAVGKNAVERGISSVMDAGDALASIAKGLTAFRALKLGKDEAVDLWGDGTLENPGSIGLVIAGISAQFGAIGGKASKESTGLLGLLGYQRNDVETGIESVMKTGQALTSVAKGVKAFMQDTKGIDAAAFGSSLQLVIGAISEAFAVVGGASNSRASSGLLGLIGIERNSVEEGISAVKDVGSTLVDLAAGVKAFANLTFKDPLTGKEVVFGPKDFEKVSLNIMTVLTAVSSAFGVIGAGPAQAGALGGLFGPGDNNVKVGVDSVKGMGSELVDLAKGVADFASLKFTDPLTGAVTLITPDMFGKEGRITKNILNVVTAVSDVFGMIGANNAPGGLFGAGDNNVKVGIDSVKGIGAELSKIAEGVKTFAEIKDLPATKKAIFDLVTIVPGAFMVAYTKYISLLPDTAMKSISKFTDILADFVDVFKEMPENLDKKSMTLGTVFDSVSRGFSAFSLLKTDNVEKVVSFMERMAKASDPLLKLADSFERIAKSMDKFSATFKKMNPATVKSSDMLIQSLVTFSKADPNAFNTLTDKGKALINFIYEKGGSQAPTPAPASQPAQAVKMQTAEPGKTPVQKATEKVGQNAAAVGANNAVNQAIIDLNTNMSNMARALSDIKNILQGTLKMQAV